VLFKGGGKSGGEFGGAIFGKGGGEGSIIVSCNSKALVF
jgi:hypothetical protein